MHARQVGSTAVLFAITVAGLVAAAPRKSTSTPASAVFRCDPADAVCTSSTLQGTIGSTGLFSADVTAAEAPLHVTLSHVEQSPECGPDMLAACNPDGPIGPMLSLPTVNIRVKPLTSDFDDLPGGLTGMPCGATAHSLVHYTFAVENTEGHWGLNLNPRAYHSTAATLTRTGTTEWVVRAVAEDVAELLSFDHSGIRRNAGPSHEGRYNLPFQLTITAASGGC